MNIRILILLIFFILSNPVELRPTKSLDQSAGELDWEAWLLIHENRPKSGKITPKSIFTVRPHSTVMPPCPEGYQSDAMGRCVTKIDQNAHYEFLVQKLNSNAYDPSDYEDTEEEIDTPTTGPFQINIPIEKSVETESGNTDTGNIKVVVAPVNDLAMNLSTINNSFNIISLTKELLKNLTTEVKVKPLERNETVLSLLDDFIQNDQPPIERDTQIDHHPHIKSTNKPIDETSQNTTTDDINLNDPETIIILFHALPNSTLNNRTEINQEETISTTENISTTEISNNTATTDFEEIATKLTTLSNMEETSVTPDFVNTEMENQGTLETLTDDEVDSSSIGLLNTFPHSGDYKASFFHLRWNDSNIEIKKNVTSPEQLNTSDKSEDIVQDILKVNLPPTISSLIPNYDKKQVKTPDYNHRSRDRNIFWYNPIYSSPQTTSERINSKYYSSDSPVSNPYRRIFRKTLQDADRVFNTRRWSNR